MNQELLEKVVNCPRLPSLPATALEVIDLCRREEVDVQELADVISRDPALSGKILRTVNSSYYSLNQPVGTISHAIVILGLNSVRTLALGFTLLGTFKDAAGQEFDASGLWQRSLQSAIAAKLLAQRQGAADQAEEVFLAALLQDVGVIAMLQAIPEQYVPLLQKAGPQHRELMALERQALDLDHAVVGEALMRKWNLPPLLREPIRHHEEPDQAPPEHRAMSRSVCLGAAAADVLAADSSLESAARFLSLARQWSKVDQAAAGPLLDEIRAVSTELYGVLETPTESQQVNSILSQANEMLLELSLQTQQTAKELEQSNQELRRRIAIDALTGAANRGHFDQCLAETFEQARRDGAALSLILIDADRFKSINDAHGHLAGDRVLVAMSEVLREQAPEGTLVARYGGEEFFVLGVGMDRRTAARIAEQIRKGVESRSVDVGGGRSLRVTVSSGVACMDSLGFFKTAEHLIKAADQAVYAAKSAGRNCVRVFTPKHEGSPVSRA